MKKTTLQSLIKKQKKRIPTLQQTQVGYDYPDMLAYYTWVQIVAFPITIKNDVQMKNKEKANFVVNVINNNSQSQNQEQSIVIQQILDAFRDELTGRQLKELKSIIAKADNDLHKAKPNIIAKLMEFGGNVASNILATILTNSASGLYL